MKVTVIGAGAWGTALARLLHQNGYEVTLWAHNPDCLEQIRRTGINERYLPGIELPRACRLESNLSNAASGAQAVVIAVPSKYFREVTRGLPDFAGLAVSVTKGIEHETGLTMSEVLRETMPQATASALSGPTLALEVARGIPGAIVAANENEEQARLVQRLFHCNTLRVYTSTDPIGVQLGGAIKNVLAIAAGTSDGLGFGDNSKAALVTRAIVEMRRLGVACGAQPETFSGLSGVGDLVVTCFSKLSRNRGFGEKLGRGEKLEQILASTVTVAEGYPTARGAFQLARKLKIETPIIDEVYAMLYQSKAVREALHDLMSRDTKPED
jgi:glycerol-3-phosphate dehydrogenase (NAD(P)+)